MDLAEAEEAAGKFYIFSYNKVMKIILKSEQFRILRFDKGDDLINDLINFCREKGVKAGFFTGLGASQEVTISYYDLHTKTYLDKTISEDLEIVSLTGNIAKMEGKIIIHSHGAFSNSQYVVFAGHVKKLIVSATCELHLIILKGNITRKFDRETGLNLMKE